MVRGLIGITRDAADATISSEKESQRQESKRSCKNCFERMRADRCIFTVLVKGVRPTMMMMLLEVYLGFGELEN